jgi:hypothetical protein
MELIKRFFQKPKPIQALKICSDHPAWKKRTKIHITESYGELVELEFQYQFDRIIFLKPIYTNPHLTCLTISDCTLYNRDFIAIMGCSQLEYLVIKGIHTKMGDFDIIPNSKLKWSVPKQYEGLMEKCSKT